MPRKAHAASCMVNYLSSNIAGQHRGLWISDALLAETFHNFCKSPRRYGSNVPGPLEARKRASKRKNTNAAYAGGSTIPTYDPAVMLGSGFHDRWWKQMNDTPTKAVEARKGPEREQVDGNTYPLLPTWLFRPLQIVPQTHNARSVESTPDIRGPVVQVQTETEDNESLFRARLTQTATLKDIRDVITEMQMDLTHNPRLSQLVFHHLLKLMRGKARSYTTLSQALYDPVFNPPGSSNHVFFVQKLCKSQLSRKSWDSIVFPSLLKAIELGLVSTGDLQKIIDLISDYYEQRSTSLDKNKLHADWHRILTAIERSGVLSLKDLDPGFLTSWFKQIASTVRTEATCFLLWRLRQYSGSTELELASNLTIARMRDFVSIDEAPSAKLLKWLGNLPSDLHGPVLIQITFDMILAAQEKEPAATKMLRQWSVVLPELHSEQISFPINKSAWSQTSVKPGNLQTSQQLLTVIWIATRLWAQHPDAAKQMADTDLRYEFESTFADMKDIGRSDHISRIILTLDTLPLPFKDEIFPFLQHFSGEHLIKMLGNEAYSEGLIACFRTEYAQLRDNVFAYNARRHFPEVLQALSYSINTDIPQFKAMAQILILKSSENFRIIRRLLENNMELKFAACRSWPAASTKATDQVDDSRLDPQAVLEMLEQLTMTFAVTPTISARSSFEHVYKMFRFLHRIGAPINPIVVRALWHSGVTRYGQTRAPKAQVLWCLSKVREIEGVEVANQLLWSAGFRDTFVRDFVHLLKSSQLPFQLAESLRQ